MSETLLNTAQAAAYIGLRPHTLAVYRTENRNLPFIRLGTGRGIIRYRLADLDAYLSASRVEVYK